MRTNGSDDYLQPALPVAGVRSTERFKMPHKTHVRAVSTAIVSFQHPLKHCPPTLVWQMATPVTASWFAGRPSTNDKKRYTD
jgi:hypothetical protein